MEKFLAFFATLVLANSAIAETLCSEHERSYFSCKIKNSKKTVSLCGNKFWNIRDGKINENAWLQYRFGTSKKIELIYPESKKNSIKQFEPEYYHPYQSFYYGLSFNIGKIQYTLSHAEGENITNYYGVTVIQNNKALKIPCEAKPEVPISTNGTNDFFSIVIELSK